MVYRIHSVSGLVEKDGEKKFVDLDDNFVSTH